jgi:hypothetical protein
LIPDTTISGGGPKAAAPQLVVAHLEQIEAALQGGFQPSAEEIGDDRAPVVANVGGEAAVHVVGNDPVVLRAGEHEHIGGERFGQRRLVELAAARRESSAAGIVANSDRPPSRRSWT